MFDRPISTLQIAMKYQFVQVYVNMNSVNIVRGYQVDQVMTFAKVMVRLNFFG